MKVQYLYHPTNDAYIAEKIISSAGLEQTYSLKGLKISDINAPNDMLLNSIKESGVLILLIGSTFDRIAPYVWMSALQNKCALFGISINTIPDEWEETRKKRANWSTEATIDDLSIGSLCTTYEIPSNEEGVLYISNNIKKWVEKSKFDASNNYGIT